MTTDRTVRDSLGEVRVPAEALYGAQTQRAVENFAVSGLRMPSAFVRALGLIKAACARAHRELGLLEADLAQAIEQAAREVGEGRWDAHFPVDVFQTGSGTSTNMNANEVIATLATRTLGRPVHPNDHVNFGQSSNDVIPSAIHVAACIGVRAGLLPALRQLHDAVLAKAAEVGDVVKTGRTHLMDAMPVTLGQEMSGWATQVRKGRERVEAALPRLEQLALGGSAVGTGINAHPELGRRACAHLAEWTGIDFRPSEDYFEALSAQDAAVELSGQIKTVAVSLTKIANDLRLMGSGPVAGLGEIALPALQPGSSIMPGKVNPVIPESVAMACAQVIGNDVTVTIAGQSGSFQLNVMLPVIAYNLLQSQELIARAARLLAEHAIAGLTVNRERIAALLDRNPVLVTALNPIIGYELGARIAMRASAEGRSVKEVAAELTDLSPDELDELLDPLRLVKGGIPGR